MHPIARLPEDWKESLLARGERPYRAQQIFRWIHARGVLDPDKMTDLGAPLRSFEGVSACKRPRRGARGPGCRGRFASGYRLCLWRRS